MLFFRKFVTLIFTIFSLHAYGNEFCDDQKTRENVLTKVGYAPTTHSMRNISHFCHYQDWIKFQLDDSKVYNDDDIEKKFINFETTQLGMLEMFRKYNAEIPEDYGNIAKEAFDRRFYYAVYSENRLREMMVWFWFNHFNVYGGGGAYVYLKSYEDIFRKNPFGNFKDILLQVAHHPNMLIYLDNELNNKPGFVDQRSSGLNENYAREFLELHTLGVSSDYTQQDVQELAKILTGFKSIEASRNYVRDYSKYEKEFSQLNTKDEFIAFSQKYPQFKITKVYDNFGLYFESIHMNGDKKFLGYDIKSNGDQELEQVIDIVTSHRDTAHFISQKLALYFLGKEGDSALIQLMAHEFHVSKGDIKRVLMAFFNSQQFKDNLQKRISFKNPYEYYISTTKLTLNGLYISDTKRIMDFLSGLSFGTYWKLTPEGYSLYGQNYLSPNNLHHYINFSKFMQNSLCFGQPIDIENNYYGMEHYVYLDFLISQQWLNK